MGFCPDSVTKLDAAGKTEGLLWLLACSFSVSVLTKPDKYGKTKTKNKAVHCGIFFLPQQKSLC